MNECKCCSGIYLFIQSVYYCCVTVYKVETTETGVQEQTSTVTQQTQSGDAEPAAAAGPNGDIAENGQPGLPEPPVMCDASMQTDREQVLESAVQTEEKQLSWALVQTDVTPLQELAVQTDIKEEVETGAQTDELEMFEQETQVELGMTEVMTQTIIEQVENVAQTDIKEFKGGMSQTDISVGWRAEKVCQAAPVVQCTETQVSVPVEDGDTQTEVVLCDGISQTEIVMNDNVSQTELEVSDGCNQTDATEVEHGEVQTDPWQGVDKATQNVAEQQLQDAQTELSFWLREHKELQTTQEEQQQTPPSGPADDSANLPVSQTSTTSSASDVADATFDQPPSLEDAEAATVPRIKDVQDDSCQTDPVTIIIGDASFLMQKIRSSAISPTKVSGSGNEIEIEVQADDSYPSQPGYDRENTSGAARGGPSPRRPPGPLRRGHPRGGVATRGGGRGARTLPPRQPTGHAATPSPGSRPAAAPRPGISPQQQQQTPAASRPQAAPAHPSPMVIQPQQEPKERKFRPTPAAGGRGKYSCPFCSITFHESPSLYEHLQDEHHSDTVSKHSKPKGREGKTIIPRLPTPAIPGEGDPSMPVLLPAVSMEKSKTGQVHQYHVVGSSIMERNVDDEGLEEDEEAEQEVVVIQQPEEPGLFEEPTEPIIRKIKKRALDELEAAERETSGSPQKAVSVREIPPEPEAEEEDEEPPPPPRAAPSKRKRRSSAGVSPKRKKQLEEEEEEEDTEERSPRVTRRGGEQSRQRTVDHEEDSIGRKTRGQVAAVSTAPPRGRGRRGRR